MDVDDFLGFGDDEIAIAASAVANRKKEIADADYADMDEQPMTKKERRVAKKEKRMAEEEQRVAMDGQRAVIRSFALAGNTAMEAYDHLCKAHGNAAMSRVNVYKRFKEFKDGRTEYRGQRGQHKTPRVMELRNEGNIAKIRDLIAEDARSTLAELSIKSGFSKSTVQQIITKDLGFTKKCARSVSLNRFISRTS